MSVHEVAKWQAKWKLEKYHEDFNDSWVPEMFGLEPYEVLEGEGNLLMYGGISTIWQCLIGAGTATGDQVNTYFDNTNAHIGVGDSSTAEAATHTDLQAASNKFRMPMDSTYPQHTPATTSGAATITFRATASSGQANFSWQEWGVFNSDTAGRMLNRRVVNLGTKASGSWTLTVTITLA